MISMSRDEFWTHIEECRHHANNMIAFNGFLEAMLDSWELPKIAAFHKVMWHDLGVYNDDALYAVVEALTGIDSDDTWECYGGWLIAQGSEFYEAVMRDPRVAATRVPPRDDIFEGESVIFVAQRVCSKKTGGKWSLYDLFGDDLSGRSPLRLEGGSMNPTLENLLNSALTLPDEDRVMLVEALLASLQPEDRPPFDESWCAVIQRRSAELRSGQVAGVPWADVKRQAREKAGG